MNDLEKYFRENQGHEIYKWKHYFELYDRHVSRYRGKEVVLVEIGVYQGGSLQMWKHYLGEKARIIGIDINPDCKSLEEEGIEILIGDQEDPAFLRETAAALPRMDIVIDDGGHSMAQQINTFDVLYPHVGEDGVYLCEDVHTSYEKDKGSGYKHPNSYIEYSKGLVDHLNGWFTRDDPRLGITRITESTMGIHFYPNMVVFEKRHMDPPGTERTGEQTVGEFEFRPLPFGKRLGRYIRRRLRMRKLRDSMSRFRKG